MKETDFFNVDKWEDRDAGYTADMSTDPDILRSVTFTLKFRDYGDWNDFRFGLVKHEGKILFQDNHLIGYHMDSWSVPNKRMHEYPLGRLWPDAITITMINDPLYAQ